MPSNWIELFWEGKVYTDDAVLEDPPIIKYFREDQYVINQLNKQKVDIIIQYSKYNRQGYEILLYAPYETLKYVLDNEDVTLPKLFSTIFDKFAFPHENIFDILPRLQYIIGYYLKKFSFVKSRIVFVNCWDGRLCMNVNMMTLEAGNVGKSSNIDMFIKAFGLVPDGKQIWRMPKKTKTIMRKLHSL